jgi:hypothetical protein
VRSRDIAGPGAAVLQIRATCDFEAEVAWAVAVNGKRPYTVTTLKNPTRLVIDMKR